MRAAIAVAYGLSLRPGEYLTQADDTPLEKQMNASDCFFVFDDDKCINVCDPQLYPVTLNYTQWANSPPTSSACSGN